MFGFYIIGLSILVIISMAIHFLRENDKRLSAQRFIVAEGVAKSVEYGCYTEWYTTRSGAMAHVTSKRARKMTCTVVRFDDGRSFVLDGRHDMPFPYGTRVRVIEDGYARRAIVSADADFDE